MAGGPGVAEPSDEDRARQDEARQAVERHIDFAWKAHEAQGEWTARVDVKASILLASQVGLLLVAAAVASSRNLSDTPLAGVLGFIAAALLIAGGAAAAAAVYPMLENSKSGGTDLLYFGRVRRMTGDEVIRGIREMSPAEELQSLAGQLTRISKANWRKHRLLQVSIWLMGAGVAVGCIALIIAR